ncbi:amidohydrolase family protein [Pelomicrobium methylotrophicum]|uniref:Amidohydrolase family protein n=1 Tax=Pelomicrobium methylotrophicum TaxID=2602750 RepID=A0A5C7ETL3_9PROT|nr:amidohydrolase family protein [Pelomicrobium methylotrophicum]TXF10697.1 amidohydrolase family protein [Pelomicrobium methylotrophicum]
MKVFDCHFHLIDPRFPLVPNEGYCPAPFTCADYLRRMAGVELAGGAVVSGSFQAFDQGYLKAALAELGPRFVGVTQLPASAADEEILALNAAGVRAVRFNVRRGGSEGLEKLESFARRVHELARWHVELYIDARELAPIADRLLRLPAVSIDHLGLSREGFPTLLRLAERGVRVKATGFGRGDLDVPRVLKDLCAANPDSLMFGTDLPSTRAPVPYSDGDLARVLDALDEPQAQKVLYRNAVAFYRPRVAD